MRKRIHGLLYDTDTAKKLAEFNPAPYAVSDFNHISEKLYKKRTGEYFLYGEGGPNTIYSKQVGTNAWSGGEKIIPLSFDEAREWYEKAMNEDEGDAPEEIYNHEFQTIKREGEKISDSYSISKTAKRVLKQLSASTGKNQSQVIEDLIMNAIKDNWNYINDIQILKVF